MLLNSKTFFKMQQDVFRMFRDSEAIKPEDVKPLADFSSSLHRAVFGGGVDTAMPVDIGSVDFTLRRIDVFKQLKLADKRQQCLLEDFGRAVQRRIFK
nr:MAG TPA_asm: hypothetical protein [Caudoviricetes sp.]